MSVLRASDLLPPAPSLRGGGVFLAGAVSRKGVVDRRVGPVVRADSHNAHHDAGR
jgi:hypothetical protein